MNYFSLFLSVLYQRFEIPLRTLSISLAGMSIIAWIRTFVLLPIQVVPRELPKNYDLSEQNFISKTCCKAKEKEIENEEETALKSKVEIEGSGKKKSIWTQFFGQMFTFQYISLCIWYCIGSVIPNIEHTLWFENNKIDLNVLLNKKPQKQE